MNDDAYIRSIADGYATSGIPALVAHRARLLEIARRLEVAQRMADALTGLMAGCEYREIGGFYAWHMKTMPTDSSLDEARAALAEWEATR